MDGVIGIVFINENKVLLQKRRDVPVWFLPGGGIDKGESPEKAVVREIYEETGIKSKVIRQVAEYSFKSGKKNYFFECEQIGVRLEQAMNPAKLIFSLPKNFPSLTIH